MATAPSRIYHKPGPAYRPRSKRVPPTAVLAARVERLYVACVSLVLCVAGTAIGFTFGVVPYFRAADLAQYDWFFTSCIAVGACVGFLVGFANGARWYRASEASPLVQRRMIAYMQRRGLDARGVPQRTVNNHSLRALLGTRRISRG